MFSDPKWSEVFSLIGFMFKTVGALIGVIVGFILGLLYNGL